MCNDGVFFLLGLFVVTLKIFRCVGWLWLVICNCCCFPFILSETCLWSLFFPRHEKEPHRTLVAVLFILVSLWNSNFPKPNNRTSAMNRSRVLLSFNRLLRSSNVDFFACFAHIHSRSYHYTNVATRLDSKSWKGERDRKFRSPLWFVCCFLLCLVLFV